MSLCQMTKFFIYLLLTVDHYNYSKIGRFTPILSVRILFKAVFIGSFLNLNLTFAIYMKLELSIFNLNHMGNLSAETLLSLPDILKNHNYFFIIIIQVPE